MVSVESIKKAVPLVEELEQIEKQLNNYQTIAQALVDSDTSFLKVNLELMSVSIPVKDSVKEEDSMAKKLKEKLEKMGMGTAIISKSETSSHKMSLDMGHITSLRLFDILVSDLNVRKAEIKDELKKYNII